MQTNIYEEFIVLCDTLNFASASERLHISKSTLSRHISELENYIGTPLFIRTPTLQKTPACMHIYSYVSRMIAQLDAELKQCAAIGRKYPHILRIGTISLLKDKSLRIADKALSDELGEIKNFYSSVEFTFSPDDLFTKLAHGEYDLILYPGCDRDNDEFLGKYLSSQLEVILLADEPLRLVLHEEHPLATKDEIAMADLRNECFICKDGTNNQSRMHIIDAAFRPFRIVPHTLLVSSDVLDETLWTQKGNVQLASASIIEAAGLPEHFVVRDIVDCPVTHKTYCIHKKKPSYWLIEKVAESMKTYAALD